MGLQLTREPESLSDKGSERCCFCREVTPYWYQPKDVAVCKGCAPYANPEDVPSKKDWLRRERIAVERTRLYRSHPL